MRTTLDIDDDVLLAAKELARREGETAGRVLSRMARAGLRGQDGVVSAAEPSARHGIEPFARRGGVVTNALIDRLRGDDAI